MKTKLKEKNEAGVLANKEKFDAERERAIELLCESEKLTADFGTMSMALPQQRVEKETKKVDSSGRRGKRYRLDKFEKQFPGVDPKKAGKLLEKKDSQTGQMRTWVKVYNEEEGIEDFSEKEEYVVKQTDVVDDGAMILGEDQLEEAFQAACDLTLTASASSGYTRAELEKSKVDTPKKRKEAEIGNAEENEEDDEDDDESEGLAPMHRLGMGRKAEDKTPKKQRGEAKEKLSAGNSLDKTLKIAQSYIVSVRTVGKELPCTLQGEMSALLDDLQKALTTSRQIQIQVLVRGNHVPLASACEESTTKVKAMQEYLKAWQSWHKARVEGRSASTKSKSPSNTSRYSGPHLRKIAEELKELGLKAF